MRPARCLLALLLTQVGLQAQEVLLDDGKAIAGVVTAVQNNRVIVETRDGRVEEFEARRLRQFVDAEGRRHRYPARLVPGEITLERRLLLQAIERGDTLSAADRLRLTLDCSPRLLRSLVDLLRSPNAAAREAAAVALAATGTPEGVEAALRAAITAGDGLLRREVSRILLQPSCRAALDEANCRELLDQGLTAEDESSRFALALVAVDLGSASAHPVLAGFLSSSDHRRREAAALALAERGDPAGESVLVSMLDGAEPAPTNRRCPTDRDDLIGLGDRRVRLRACCLCGELRLGSARAALTALTAAADEELARVARAALRAIDRGTRSVALR
ncbi:MAG: hypothetical protein H6807_07565 [Planctomycetes bacterium]|nr:hypothetical protein [Planctomycetota bacterium]